MIHNIYKIKASNIARQKSLYETAKYNPSIATLACQIPNFLIALKNAGAGKIRQKQTGNRTTREMEKMSVMLGLMTRK
jgi:hypothetical protein